LVAVVLRCLFFFFQAEDGIRDFHVTGVQTCALPILDRGAFRKGKPPRRVPAGSQGRSRSAALGQGSLDLGTGVAGRPAQAPVGRSEERRVGKEGRSRWSRETEKKKDEVAYDEE